MKLPLNCTVNYYDHFLSKEDSNVLFEKLMKVVELTQMAVIKSAGVDIEMNFGKVMFVDDDLLNPGIFNKYHSPHILPWPHFLIEAREKVKKITKVDFQTCVAIYYPDGHSWSGYHSDLIAFGSTQLIPSMSLGEIRTFQLREKSTHEVYSINLNHGSLIVMGEGCQDKYEHALPQNPKYLNPRINLTFRQFDSTTE